ncbi:unnamed protein product [Moneuplotes crassus]|uniref:Uncharacterized protein n=1 Tax=Euplotes crassus TaxID=5936 RepID=A0AAD1U4W6_EUPCR|nr:unnamed protein product [Moneuplotes crassus]
MIRKSEANTLRKDLFVCSMCMITHFSDQAPEPIPEIDPIIECLNCAQHNLKKIDFFRNEHKLDDIWDRVLPQHEEFKASYKTLQEELHTIKTNGQWNKLVDFQVEAKTFLNSIFESELMKQFNRQLHCREFKESKSADSMTSYMSKAAVRAKVQEIQQTITAEQVNPLKEVLRRATERDREKNTQLERLEQDKEELDQTIQTLTQEKDNSEQVSAQRQLEIDSLTQQIQALEEEQEQHNRQAEEMKQEILALEDTLQQSKNTLDHAGLKAIHNAMMKASTSFNEDSEFTINVNNTVDQELLKALQLFRLPPLKQFTLWNIHAFNKPEVITKFLGNALSENVKYFRIDTNTGSCLDLSPYMDTLTKTLPLIPSRVELVFWTITSSQFQDILVAAQNTDYVRFCYCKIDAGEEVDFGGRLDQAAFTTIDFESTGGSSKSNWSQNGFETFKNIVKGLAKVESVKNRQVSINLKNCGMSKDQAESILQENGMINMVVKGL